MKSFIKIISFATVLLVVITSCNKQLDQYPDYQISAPTFFKSANDAELALTGCYSTVQNIAYDYWYFDGASDNSYDQYPWESGATNISAGNISAGTTNGIGGGDYGSFYQSIRNCNTFLDKIDGVDMDATTKSQYIGEVKFLRAYDYFLLAEMFGDVPLITSSDKTQDTLTAQPEADVINFVISELGDAAQVLPVSPAAGGRASQGAALALKARVELFYGKWTDAAADAKTIMNSGNYSLFHAATADMSDDYSGLVSFANDADKQKFYQGMSNYLGLFYSANEGNSEIIFECQFSDAASYSYTGLSNGLVTLLPPSDLNGWSSISPTQSLVNSYWNRDGSTHAPVSQAVSAGYYDFPNTPQPVYFNDFKNRDTRLYASIFFTSNSFQAFAPGWSFVWGGPGNNNSATGYNFKKMLDPAYANNPGWQAGNSFPLIRYAEVLLTYAEAKNEASGPDASIYDALNLIRERSGMPDVDENIYNTQASLRTLIRNERRIELAGEGSRYFDIRRWNIAPDVMTDVYDNRNSLTQARSWDTKYVKLPYPQSAVDANPRLQTAQAAKGY
ncbi:MAG: RagB/SusD family nutrient uptake outer membrane protein [Bacteroidetes bacterium]|nr:RagB/SusD family nutrient uptake outer membrane protein [Bacteroidota bacterium]